jgi:hypothetical protein
MSRRFLVAASCGLVLAAVAALVSPAPARAQAVVNALQALRDRIDAQVVPFKVVIPGGLCDSAGQGTSTPALTIDSDGAEGEFVVTSILLGTTPPGIPTTGFEAFSINLVDIDSTRFFTRSGNILGPTDGDGVYESADIMGMPVRRNGDSDAPLAGGNFPHQIVAQSAGSGDIHIEFFCSTDDTDVSFAEIQVSGWKRPADTVTVTFTPGS